MSFVHGTGTPPSPTTGLAPREDPTAAAQTTTAASPPDAQRVSGEHGGHAVSVRIAEPSNHASSSGTSTAPSTLATALSAPVRIASEAASEAQSSSASGQHQIENASASSSADIDTASRSSHDGHDAAQGAQAATPGWRSVLGRVGAMALRDGTAQYTGRVLGTALTQLMVPALKASIGSTAAAMTIGVTSSLVAFGLNAWHAYSIAPPAERSLGAALTDVVKSVPGIADPGLIQLTKVVAVAAPLAMSALALAVDDDAALAVAQSMFTNQMARSVRQGVQSMTAGAAWQTPVRARTETGAELPAEHRQRINCVRDASYLVSTAILLGVVSPNVDLKDVASYLPHPSDGDSDVINLIAPIWSSLNEALDGVIPQAAEVLYAHVPALRVSEDVTVALQNGGVTDDRAAHLRENVGWRATLGTAGFDVFSGLNEMVKRGTDNNAAKHIAAILSSAMGALATVDRGRRLEILKAIRDDAPARIPAQQGFAAWLGGKVSDAAQTVADRCCAPRAADAAQSNAV